VRAGVAALGFALAGGSSAVAQSGPEISEVVVTATRSAEVLSRVPISVAAYTQEQMDQQGVRQFSDVVALTPGVSFNTDAFGGNDVSIRGIRSNAGAATTGIYIDDVPIQQRQLVANGSVFPAIFDLERVEVLRGPQGTLFGSGSQGGTIRFIQPQPSLNDYSGYARLEGAISPKHDNSYEGGVAMGGPIIQDKLGFRASAYYRYDGGWIDKVPGVLTVVDRTGASRANSISFTPTGKGETDYNWTKTLALRGALKMAPTENFSITPSVFYQRVKLGGGNENLWLGMSDFGDSVFRVPEFNPLPANGTTLTDLTLPDTERGRSDLFMTAVNMQWDLDAVSLYSTSSYLRQHRVQYYDYTFGYTRSYNFEDFVPPGGKYPAIVDGLQNSFVQEFRIQYTGDRLKATAGAYYQHSRQKTNLTIQGNTWYYANNWFGDIYSDDSSPFGPGHPASEQVWGYPLLPGSTVYYGDEWSKERQLAGYGQVDFKLTEQLSIVAGVRYSRNWLRYEQFLDGPENNLTSPFGADCPTGPVCPFNNGGPFAPEFPGGVVKTAENSFAPKVGLNFQMDPDNLFYGSIAKGYRPGGGQMPVPAACNETLLEFGYVDSNGRPYTPPTYESDTVWSYELGSKNRLFNGMVSFAGSAYLIKWKNIQTSITLPVCGYGIIDNLTSATVKGFDVELDVRPMDGLTLGVSAGYNEMTLDEELLSPTGQIILPGDAPVAGSGAPWRVVVSADYTRPINETMDFYARTDINYTGKMPRIGTQIPGVLNYDRLLEPTGDYTIVNARMGIRRDSVDLSVFVNNLFDEHPLIGETHSRNRGWTWTGRTVRPRIMGVTASYRY
jgi:outer membrane receptor protein involved in Fe transport